MDECIAARTTSLVYECSQVATSLLPDIRPFLITFVVAQTSVYAPCKELVKSAFSFLLDYRGLEPCLSVTLDAANIKQ